MWARPFTDKPTRKHSTVMERANAKLAALRGVSPFSKLAHVFVSFDDILQFYTFIHLPAEASRPTNTLGKRVR